MCACDDSVSRAEKFRRSIDGLKRGALIGCHPRNFCAQNDVFVGVRVGFVLRLTLDKQIGMCPPPRAWKSTMNGRGAWWNAIALHMRHAFDNQFFQKMGLYSLLAQAWTTFHVRKPAGCRTARPRPHWGCAVWEGGRARKGSLPDAAKDRGFHSLRRNLPLT